jgi:predicted nucleotidyltransferase
MSHRENITRIKAVYNALGELRDQVVFVGGATVSLYSDRDGFEFRPTDDVDIVIELLNLSDYTALEEKLRSIGFKNDQESHIICRYKIDGIVVDFMPTQGDILNFSNQWYPDGYKNAISYSIDDLHTVKIFTAPYFLASKFDAFNDRGKHDGRTSSDFEDIVSVLERRRTVWSEINSAPADVKIYIQNSFKELLENIFLEEWINAHIDFISPPSTYIIIENMKTLVAG